MKLKYDFEAIELGDEIVLVPIGEHSDKVRGILKVNNSTMEILSLLKNNISENQIIITLQGKYENNPQILNNYIQKVLSVLRENDLIIE